MITVEQINSIFEITESYKAPETIMNILFDKDKREKIFKEFLKIEWDLSYDWFHTYFQEEHADRKVKKQDFTPNSISEMLSLLVGNDVGAILDVAAGTGGITIKKWDSDYKKVSPFKYYPSNYLYQCEELSDRAIPFLLFNLMIRGMNATVVHGDVLTREVKQVYFIQNCKNDFMSFSSLNVMPHNNMIKKEFNINKWMEDDTKHIEDSLEDVFDWNEEK